MTKTHSNNTPTLKQLIEFRERVRIELLGQRDPEWRQEVKQLLSATDQKIREVKARDKARQLLGV